MNWRNLFERRVIMGVALMVVAGFGSPVWCADPAFVGKLAIAVSEEGAKRLNLSDEVKQRLLELIDRREQEALSTALEIKDLPPEQIAARLAPFVAESERLGAALLTVEQRAKLDQLKIAQGGMSQLADPDLAKVLSLNDDQRKQIETLLAERSRALTRGGENERRVTHAEFERKLAAVLTNEQRANWENLAGLSDAPAQAEKTDLSESAEPPSSTRTATDADQPPSDESPNDRPAERDERDVVDTREWADGEERLKFNFHHAPWKDVLEWLSEEADLSLQMDAPPPGTCNYRDTRSYTTAEAIDIINRMLVTKGYMLVRHRRLLMLHNLEDPLPPQLVELVSLEELERRGEFELVKCLFPLSKLETTDAEAEVQKLIGPQGNIVALPKSRQLLVTETAGRLRAIKRVLDEVENPSGGRMESIRQIALRHVGVEDFLTIARPLLGIPDGQNSTADMRLAMDPFSPRIFATGTAETLRRLEEIVPMVDRPLSTAGGPSRPLEQPQLDTYSITKADPATVKNVLSTLLAGLPDVRLDVDPVTKKVIALARPSEHRTIIETLKQLEGSADQIEVIQLKKLDPQLVILSINKLFSEGTGKDSTSTGPKVDGDPTSMKLWVRGTSAQIAQVKDLVEKLEGPSSGQAGLERQPLRFMPLTGSSAQQTIESIESLWPALHANKIRIVTPSAISPSLRQQVPSRDGSGVSREQPSSPAIPPQLPKGPVPLRRSGNQAVPPRALPQRESRTEEDNTTRASVSTEYRFVSFQAEGEPPAASADDQESNAQDNNPGAGQDDAPNIPPVPSESQAERPADPPANVPPDQSPPAQPQPNREGAPPPEILVTVTPQGIFIASQDLDALDDFEQLLQLYIEQRGVKSGEPTVFWLKHARAEVAAELLQQVITGNTGDSGGGGSLIGDVATSMLGDSGGLLGGLLGLGGSSGGSTYTGPTTIVPDVRLNALIVQGRAQDLMLIEKLLPIVDSEASPEEVLTAGKPRLIPVNYMSAQEMANIVRQLYGDRIAGANNNQQRQPNPEDFIRALRGGGGGRSRNENRGEVAKMSIGVDTRSNSLIVAAPDSLYREVEELVAQLDLEGSQTDDSMSVVTIKSTNAQVLQKALVSITGGQVKASTQTATPSTTSSTQSQNQQPQPSPFGQGNPDDFRRRMEMFRGFQQGGQGGQGPFGFPGGGGGGNPFGQGGPGGFGGGGFRGFGGGGGDRGGGDRGGGDRGGGNRGGGDRRGR